MWCAAPSRPVRLRGIGSGNFPQWYAHRSFERAQALGNARVLAPPIISAWTTAVFWLRVIAAQPHQTRFCELVFEWALNYLSVHSVTSRKPLQFILLKFYPTPKLLYKVFISSGWNFILPAFYPRTPLHFIRLKFYPTSNLLYFIRLNFYPVEILSEISSTLNPVESSTKSHLHVGWQYRCTAGINIDLL